MDPSAFPSARYRTAATAMLLAPLLASCQPGELVVRAAFVGDALVFVAADPGEAESSFCWKDVIVVDDSLDPAWRFSAAGTGECRLFPLIYGRAPAAVETSQPARAIEPGRLYLFIGDATAPVSGAFAISRSGDRRIVHNVDPDSPAAAALRQRWRQRRPGPASPAP
jgi:hypothetical protein